MKLNQNYANLQESYLFLTIAKKVAAYTEAHPDNHIIRMGIGDVTQPLVPAVIEAMHKATDEMAHKETFHAIRRIRAMISCVKPFRAITQSAAWH